MRDCGREFSDADLACIRRIAAGEPGRTRRAISRLVCEEFGWRKPDGGRKDMSCFSSSLGSPVVFLNHSPSSG